MIFGNALERRQFPFTSFRLRIDSSSGSGWLPYNGTGLFLLRGVQWIMIFTAFSNPLRA